MEKLVGCNFVLNIKELVEKYNGIWKKVSNSIKKELDFKFIYNRKI